MAVGVRSIEEIRGKRVMACFDRLAFAINVRKQAFFGWLIASACKSDNYAVDSSAPGPHERSMSESDLQAESVEQNWPELRHLLTLRDRICRDEG